jgi:hypothetical protein
MRTYGQIQTSFWTHPETQSLSDRAKLMAAYLMTGPHSNGLGCFRLPNGYAAEDLRWTVEVVTETFEELEKAGLAYRDPETGWTILPDFLKWNPIQNSNIGIKIARLAEKVPETTSIYGLLVEALRNHVGDRLPKEFLNHLETVSHTVSKPFAIPFRNRSETVSHTVLNPQEPDREPERKESLSYDRPAEPVDSEQKGGHFSNHVGKYREAVLDALGRFDDGRLSKVNVYSWVQKHVRDGPAHPEALIDALTALDQGWNRIKKPWPWLEKRFNVENPNLHERDYMQECEEFKAEWQEWLESDAAKEILADLKMPRAP